MAEVTLGSLLASARTLLQQGWCQGEFTRDAAGRKAVPYRASQWCLAAALAEASALTPELYGPLKQLVACKILEQVQLGFQTGRPPTSGHIIAVWNDTPGRTQAEVLGLLDALLEEL